MLVVAFITLSPGNCNWLMAKWLTSRLLQSCTTRTSEILSRRGAAPVLATTAEVATPLTSQTVDKRLVSHTSITKSM